MNKKLILYLININIDINIIMKSPIFTVNNKNFYIHKMGFVVNLNTGHVSITKTKTNYISLSSHKFKFSKLIYCTHNNLDYKTNLYVYHIDNNVLNNNLNNLIATYDKNQYIGVTMNNKYYSNIIDYILLFKRYDLNYKLINVYINFKLIESYFRTNEIENFLVSLFENNYIYYNNYIWELEIIKVDINNANNYKLIPNTYYKISIDGSHILDLDNNIIKYKVDRYNHQYILITDIYNNYKKIIYQYNSNYIDYFPEFINLLNVKNFDIYNYIL